MIELRKQLNKILKSIHPRVYYMKATDKETFPYIVYDLPQSYSNDDQEIFNLDIDIWDNNQDTTELEILSGTIWNELDRYHFIDEGTQFSIYRQGRFTIDDDDPRIKRRTLTFNIRYFDRRVR